MPAIKFTLAINTASQTESVALLLGKEVVAEKIWLAKQDESEKLIKNISDLFKAGCCELGNIGRIIAVRGPGPFSALRIGITVANVMGFIRKIPIFSIDTVTLWKLRTPGHGEARLLLHAGGTFVALCSPGRKPLIREMREHIFYTKRGTVLYGDITEEEKELITEANAKKINIKFVPEDELKSFGECALLIAENMLSYKFPVEPEYWKPPNIT